MTTATDELRAMLDERGVEWHTPNSLMEELNESMARKMTFWGDDDCYCAIENFCGGFSLSDLTPAQAIEATLGRGTCRDLGDGQMFICSECGCTLDIQDENGEPTMMVDGVADVPKCCPNCKREVVDG